MIRVQDNFLQYAMAAYNNPSCTTIEEFNEDLYRFTTIKRLFGKGFNSHKMLNLLVVQFNSFSPKECVTMLFFKIESEYWSKLKTFLVYLNFMPESIEELNIISSNIALDVNIVEELRNL